MTNTATPTDPTALTDDALEQALFALLDERSRRKPADAPMGIGDRVVVGDVTPRYLTGRVGTVTALLPTNIDVALDDPTGVKSGYLLNGNTVRLHPELATRVS